MIRLTRLRRSDPLYLNPDHIERLEGHHDTVVHLLNGTEYVVVESPDEIVELVIHFRARSIAAAAQMAVVGIPEREAAGIDPVHAVSAVEPMPIVVRDTDADHDADHDARRDADHDAGHDAGHAGAQGPTPGTAEG